MKTDEVNPLAIVDHGDGRAMSQVIKNTFDSNIDEWNYKWDGPVVTWKLDKKNDDLQPYNVQRILTLAFMAWGLHTKQIRFRLLRRSTADADIPISFLKKEEDQLFKDQPGVLAYAYFPQKSSKIGGDMVFNDDYIWSRDGKGVNAHLVDPEHYPADTKVLIKSYNLQHTGCHEIGHAIGLKHAVNCPGCVMHPYYNEEVWPQTNDLERIQGIYEKREFKNPRRYEVLSKRVQEMWKPRSVQEIIDQRTKRNTQQAGREERIKNREERKANRPAKKNAD
jgi:hypothetical protein